MTTKLDIAIKFFSILLTIFFSIKSKIPEEYLTTDNMIIGFAIVFGLIIGMLAGVK